MMLNLTKYNAFLSHINAKLSQIAPKSSFLSPLRKIGAIKVLAIKVLAIKVPLVRLSLFPYSWKRIENGEKEKVFIFELLRLFILKSFVLIQKQSYLFQTPKKKNNCNQYFNEIILIIFCILVVLIYNGYFVVKKLARNVCIEAFWYTIYV